MEAGGSRKDSPGKGKHLTGGLDTLFDILLTVVLDLGAGA
jgi:hypothetical protein